MSVREQERRQKEAEKRIEREMRWADPLQCDLRGFLYHALRRSHRHVG